MLWLPQSLRQLVLKISVGHIDDSLGKVLAYLQSRMTKAHAVAWAFSLHSWIVSKLPVFTYKKSANANSIFSGRIYRKTTILLLLPMPKPAKTTNERYRLVKFYTKQQDFKRWKQLYLEIHQYLFDRKNVSIQTLKEFFSYMITETEKNIEENIPLASKAHAKAVAFFQDREGYNFSGVL